MRIRSLYLKNIRSYKEQEIIFPEGSLLLSGDVGSGKTSVLLAIEYAFFGLQPGQTGSGLLRNNSQIGEVRLDFEVDGKQVIIERKLKKGKTVTNDYAALTLNGQKKEYSITELKIKILRLLGYPDEFIKKNNLLYRYTVYTQQEQMKQIILEDPEIRLTILRHIFGIDKYKNLRENLSLITNKLKEETKLLQVEIKNLDVEKTRFNSIKSLINTLDERIKEKEIELKEKIQIRKKCEEDIHNIEQKIKGKEKLEFELEKGKVLRTSKKEQLISILQEHNHLVKALEELGEPPREEEFNSVLTKLASSSSMTEHLQATFIEISSQISTLEQRRNEISKKKERIFSIDMCPTCLQDVPEVHKHNIKNEIERELSLISRTQEEIELKRSQISLLLEKEKLEQKKLSEQKLQLEIKKSKFSELEKARRKIQEIEKQKEAIEKDIILLDQHIENLKEEILKCSPFQNVWKRKQEELKGAFINEKNIEITIAELRKELELTKKEIDFLLKSINEKEKIKERLINISEISDWLSNHFSNLIQFTERQVMMKLRLAFSQVFSKWFHMIGGDAFTVQLDENFTPLVMQGETEMEYSFLSGGERTALALAYRLALNQTINSLISQIKTRDFIILDEPTEGFSEAQIEKIRDILIELKVKQLIIVSHEQKIEGFVDHVIRLRKEEDFSFIEKKAISSIIT